MTSPQTNAAGLLRTLPISLHSMKIGMGLLALLAIGGFVGFQQLFSSFAIYDDEGYVLLSLRMFMSGRPLYDNVYSQYGPAYYVTQAVLHGLTGIPVSNDAARWKTLFVWLLSAGLGGLLVKKMTGRNVLTVLASLAVFFQLDRLGLEPGHPQDLCLPAIMGILFLSTWVQTDRVTGWALVTIAALSGVVLATKSNLGIFLVLTLTLSVLATTRKNRWRNILLALSGTAALAMPFLLARESALTWEGLQLPSVVFVGAAGLLVATRNRSTEIFPISMLVKLWSLIGIVVALFIGAAVFTGTTSSGLYWGLIGQHAQFAKMFYHTPPLLDFAAFWAGIALVPIVFSVGKGLYPKAMLWAAPLFLIVICLRYLQESSIFVVHGIYDRGCAGLLVSFITPMVCLLPMAVGSCQAKTAGSTSVAEKLPDYRFARWMLAWSAVLQPLAAFPTPGTQLAIGAIPALLAVFLLVSDWATAYESQTKNVFRYAFSSMPQALTAVAVIALGIRGWNHYERRSSYQSLELSGATLLRLPPHEAAAYRKTVKLLRDEADTFVTLPNGYNSFYLWAEIEPPTGFNATIWPHLLTDVQQKKVITSLEKAHSPRLVVIPNRPDPPPESSRLAAYLSKQFTACESNGPVQVWAKPTVTPVAVGK